MPKTLEKPKKAGRQTTEERLEAEEKSKIKDNRVVWLDWREARINKIFPNAYAKATARLTKADEVLSPEEQAELKKTVKFVRLIPDLHSYPVMEWNAIKDHPSVIKLLKNGRLKLWTVGELDPKADPDNENPIQKLPETLDNVATGNAKELADACSDIKVLKKWKEAEERGKARGTVLQSIDAKMETILEVNDAMDEAGGDQDDKD